MYQNKRPFVTALLFALSLLLLPITTYAQEIIDYGAVTSSSGKISTTPIIDMDNKESTTDGYSTASYSFFDGNTINHPYEKELEEIANPLFQGVISNNAIVNPSFMTNTMLSFAEHPEHTIIVQSKIPTCFNFGYSLIKCEDCNKILSHVTIQTVPHYYNIVVCESTTAWKGYDNHVCIFCNNSYQDNYKPKLKPDQWPKGYQDETGKITIYKEWYEHAYVYAAHLEFTDYSRLTTDGAYGKNNAGRERVSDAAERVGAIFMVNGDWAVPGNMANSYAIARNGVVFANGIIEAKAVYNNKTGILTSPSALGIRGCNISSVVQEGIITDTFQFADAFLVDGTILTNKASTSRAQRTFIGTNGEPGDIWICVSDGRMNDNESSGLTGYQCASFLKDKGCVFGVPLDGGGSSTIWFQGEVLNAASKGQRAVADFVIFK